MGRSGSASEAELAIVSLDAELRGVGTLGERSVSVPGVLPGERVRVRIDHVDRKQHAYATLLTVLEPSPSRVASPCARFLDCSGCDLLHATPETQREAKRARVAAALGVEVEPVLASPRELGYRAFAKLVVGPGGRLGSYRARTHDVAQMSGCRVHAPELETIAEAIRALDPSKLRYVLIRGSLAEKRALVVLVTRSEDQREARRISETLSRREDVHAVYHQLNSSEGDELDSRQPYTVLYQRPGSLRERIGEISYALEPGAFAQVNPLAAERLYARAVELAQPAGKKILDLYSGSAGLALFFKKAGARDVLAVESIERAVHAGERSARENGVDVRFLTARAEDAPEEQFDVVVLNPPRKGASPEVLAKIERLAPPQIVYVSCNPDTLARDLATLLSYAIEAVTPVDLFPGTRHVETVVSLRRKTPQE
jgi:23S rRNA (uracil1939-C5)-methyltransferase